MDGLDQTKAGSVTFFIVKDLVLVKFSDFPRTVGRMVGRTGGWTWGKAVSVTVFYCNIQYRKYLFIYFANLVC